MGPPPVPGVRRSGGRSHLLLERKVRGGRSHLRKVKRSGGRSHLLLERKVRGGRSHLRKVKRRGGHLDSRQCRTPPGAGNADAPIADQSAGSSVHQELELGLEVYTKDGKIHGRPEEGPSEAVAP